MFGCLLPATVQAPQQEAIPIAVAETETGVIVQVQFIQRRLYKAALVLRIASGLYRDVTAATAEIGMLCVPEAGWQMVLHC